MMTTIDYQWIDSDVALVQLCQQLAQNSAIALDTEFVRTRTYFPHVGLLQIADEKGVYLIDPLAITEMGPLAELLENPTVVKVIHACSEDLEVFQYALGVLPSALFDTQVAAGFAGYGTSIGYAKLLGAAKGIDIPKHETRSDWLQRPLSEAQLRYAAVDVMHLLDLYQVLVEQLKQSQRLSWVESDCLAIINKQREVNHDDNYYRRVKSAWKLPAHQLAVLQALCRWREQQARTQDVPRNRILKDNSLFDMAQRLPSTTKQLRCVQDINPRFVDDAGKKVLSIIQIALDDPTCHPDQLPRPLFSEQVAQLKQLKLKVQEVATSLSIPAELLVRKKDYEALLRSNNDGHGYRLPASLSGWRRVVVGEALLSTLTENNKLC